MINFVLLFSTIFLAYVRVYDFAWAFDASGFLGGKLKKLIHEIQDEMQPHKY